MQIFVGGSSLGGCDDLLQLIADKQLHQLLQKAQGKVALPKGLQDAVYTASTSSDASTNTAFVPGGFDRDTCNGLQQLAVSMANAKHAIHW